MPIDLALDRLRAHAAAEREHHTPTARWFAALVNQLSLAPKKDKTDKARTGSPHTADLYTAITPLFSPSGRMTLANTWTKAVQECRADETHLHAALTAWRRVDGYAGGNLDHHSTGDAHMVSTGEATQQGVPGATWLALHGFASFRLTGDSTRGQTTSWDRTTSRGALTWPVWRQPLSLIAIIALLEHPLVRTPNHDPTKLTNLGVVAVYTAPRTRLSQSDGPLQLGHRIYPKHE
jgi:hypothetical protein